MSLLSDGLQQPRRLARTMLIGMAVVCSLPGVVRSAGAPAAPAVVDRGTERGLIDAERRQMEASFGLAKAACQGRFRLTQCLDEARITRRLALNSLQRRQLALDDVERRERSALRLQALQAHVGELTQATPPTAAAFMPSIPASRGLTVQQMERVTAAPDLPAGAATASTVGRSSMAASAQRQRNPSDYLQRQQQAMAHRDAVLGRNARQDASKPPAAGLPVPAAASH